MTFQPQFTARYIKHYRTLPSQHTRIDKGEERILGDPYSNTERLGFKRGSNLNGCRSARVGQNFCISIVICEECLKEPECEYCFCEGLSDQTVVFLTVGPHEKAYRMK